MFDPYYQYNDLAKLPPAINFRDPDLLDLLIKAHTQLGELKGYSFSLPNPMLLLSPAILKESLASSEIENIHTTMIQVLEGQIFSEEERMKPDKEVLRYRDAIMWGYERLGTLNLSTRLTLGIQNQLLPGDSSGYRTLQNAIQNDKTKEILYTPPVQSEIPRFMGDLENFLNDPPQGADPLLVCILSHYQFEAIHPFNDGNGRTGRILMVLSLVKYKILSWPILYISGYINEHKTEYYKRLLEVTTLGNWTEYIKFMLVGFAEQASETKDLIFKIMKLYWDMKDEVKLKNKKIYSADLLEAIFSLPVISPVKLGELLGCHYTTASRHLKALESMGILKGSHVGRYQLYSNWKLLDLVRHS